MPGACCTIIPTTVGRSNSPSYDLILASASRRRAEILSRMGVSYHVIAAHVDERATPDEKPSVYVQRIALDKAEAVIANQARSTPVLAADTAVVADECILGKPASMEDASSMLKRLSGCWHEVYTGVAIVHRKATVICVRTRVKFRPIVEHEIAVYWASGEPQDKAGGYAIQGLGGAFVERIDGSYSNVVGLPLSETLSLLDDYGVAHVFALGARAAGSTSEA